MNPRSLHALWAQSQFASLVDADADAETDTDANVAEEFGRLGDVTISRGL